MKIKGIVSSRNPQFIGRLSRKTSKKKQSNEAKKILIKLPGENGKSFLVSPTVEESIRCYQTAMEC